MANRKISDLTALTAPATGDLLPIVDISEAAAADKNKKITYGELLASAPAGSAAAPSFSFEGNSNTGIYSPGTDQVAISTGGTARITVDASGNVNIDSNTVYVDAANNRVGIGTSSPGSSLHVNTASGDCKQTISASAGTTSAFTAFVNTTVTTVGTENSAGGNLVAGSSAYATILSNNGAYPIQFGTNNTVRATLDSSGRLGIGTTSPGYLLTVSGGATSLAANQYLRFGAGLFASGDGSATNYLFTGSSGLAIRNAADTSEFARIDSSGRLLVGTSSTSASLTALLQGNSSSATSNAGLLLARGEAPAVDGTVLGALDYSANNHVLAARILCKRDGGTWTAGTSQPTRLEFSTTPDGAASPTERMRINSGGAVAIGLTTPLAKFHIDGVGGSNNQALNVTGWGSGVGGGAEFKAVSTANADVIYFSTSAANVGKIAITSTATSYVTSSDYRLKENVIPVANATSRLKQLKPSRFNFIAEPDKFVDGFIAHEAQAVVPECVTGTKDEVDEKGNPVYQGIDQSKMVPLAVAAIQECVKRIESLEAELALLKATL